MASLFVSHSSHDRDEAERVAQRLQVEGFAALFLDFDPAYGIPAGRDWQRELYAQLRKTDGVIFLASAAITAYNTRIQLRCINTVRLYYKRVNAVNGNARTRTRRSDKAERTRQAILQAASKLFAEQGFAATTISAIAAEADVAAETVYSRFGNKLTLISEILETAIVGNAQRVDVLELPEIAKIRAITDQRTQLARLAHLSRGILERTALAHRILRNSGTADPALADFVAADRQRRHRHQTAYIAMLLDSGPLREGMSGPDAAAIYGALANPDTYAELTTHRGWSPDHYENWLSDTLTLLLLPPPLRTAAPTNRPNPQPRV